MNINADTFLRAAELIDKGEQFCCHALCIAQGVWLGQQDSAEHKLFFRLFRAGSKPGSNAFFSYERNRNGEWVPLIDTACRSHRVFALLLAREIALNTPDKSP